MKITFLADKTPQATRALYACIQKYGQADLAQADVVISLGGDGFMLQTLQKLLNYQTPVFGLNLGHVGYLLNQYQAEADLPDRIDQAEKVSLTPLHVQAESRTTQLVDAYAFNEFALMRQSPQAARLEVITTDEKQGKGIVSQSTVFGDGLIVATSIGSHGYYASAGGQPLSADTDSLGIKSVCSKINYNSVVSGKAHICVVPKEYHKRPVHLDCDGKRRFTNITTATIQAEPTKRQTLLMERFGKSR